MEALQEYEGSEFGDDTARVDLKSPTSFNTVMNDDPEQVKIKIVMQLGGLISSISHADGDRDLQG